MSLTYNTYVTTLASMVPIATTDANYVTILPNCIDYAEQRIYRELDLISTVGTAVGTLVASNRNLAIPGSVIVVNSVNAITPAGTAPDAGARNTLQRVSLEYLNFVWPSVTGSSVPKYYALLDNANIRVGPWPDGAYQLEFIGTTRPAPLSATNQTTFLSTYLPDLFFAASMIFIAGWMRDFGQLADDPQMAQSWENQYQLLKTGAAVEEARKKAQSAAWQPYSPAPLATPPRQ